MISDPESATRREFATMLVRVGGGRLGAAAALSTALAFTASVSVLLLVPLLQLVGVGGGTPRLDAAATGIERLFAAAGVQPTLGVLLAGFVVISAAQALFDLVLTRVTFELVHDVEATVRRDLFRAIAGTSWTFFVRQRGSDLVHALTQETERVGAAAHYAIRFVSAAATTTALVVCSLVLVPLFTTVGIAAALGVLILIRGGAHAATRRGEEVTAVFRRLHATIGDYLAAMKSARMNGAAERYRAGFDELTADVRSVRVRGGMAEAWIQTILQIAQAAVLAAIVWIAVDVLVVAPASLFITIAVFLRIVPTVGSLQRTWLSMRALLPSYAALAALKSRFQSNAEPESDGAGAAHLSVCREIALDCVTAGYGGAPVIRDVSLVIPGGSVVAIAGPSGAGKTTLADVLTGLLAPERGRLVVDDVVVEGPRVHAWRHSAGYVAQDAFLFNDTVRANLVWGSPKATDNDIRDALGLAAAEFVWTLPQGIDTIVGDRGALLSGGERQRLALARAILRRPSLLVLDETTGALDAANERRILDAIDELRGRTTVLLISHRLSTVRTADVIYVMEDGHIRESGSWDELLTRRNSLFAASYRLQHHLQTGAPSLAAL